MIQATTEQIATIQEWLSEQTNVDYVELWNRAPSPQYSGDNIELIIKFRDDRNHSKSRIFINGNAVHNQH